MQTKHIKCVAGELPKLQENYLNFMRYRQPYMYKQPKHDEHADICM
jgi:hypothetical protein